MDECCFDRKNLADGEDNNIICMKCGSSRRVFK